MNSDFDSVGCDSRIKNRIIPIFDSDFDTKIGLFLSLIVILTVSDVTVASDTVKITVRVNRP
jgi:hypothetical protein